MASAIQIAIAITIARTIRRGALPHAAHRNSNSNTIAIARQKDSKGSKGSKESDGSKGSKGSKSSKLPRTAIPWHLGKSSLG